MLTYSKTAHTDKAPFLSIITRCYKRPVGLSRNQASISGLTDKDIEQIFITDNCGLGLLSANTSFSDPQTRELVTGSYVFLLDDDDFIIEPDFIGLLKGAAETDRDIIFFRMNIIGGPNGDLYPTPETWMKEPKVAHIGGSCFIVKREIYEKHISAFALPRMGDFAFIKAVWDSGASSTWLNNPALVEAGNIGRGRPE